MRRVEAEAVYGECAIFLTREEDPLEYRLHINADGWILDGDEWVEQNQDTVRLANGRLMSPDFAEAFSKLREGGAEVAAMAARVEELERAAARDDRLLAHWEELGKMSTAMIADFAKGARPAGVDEVDHGQARADVVHAFARWCDMHVSNWRIVREANGQYADANVDFDDLATRWLNQVGG